MLFFSRKFRANFVNAKRKEFSALSIFNMSVQNQNTILWNKCLDIFRDNLPEEQFNAWFAPIVAISYENDVLKIGVPSEFYKERIEETYINLMRKTLKRVYGDRIRLVYQYKVAKTNIVEGNSNDSIIKTRASRQEITQPANPFEVVQYDDIDPQLNPRYTFENYCGSACNKLALTIGQTIANDPNCKTFNPLFVFGTTGVGKTHLIQAIGVKIKENNPRTRVLYISADVFEKQYITAVRNNKVPDFINFYQSIDVLIIDDIQYLAGKIATLNTFYHIFNHLHQSQKQLIISSDCRPADMDGMIPRLLSRFKWGMTVELEKPDYELRRSVLEQKALQDGLTIPDDVIEYIATNVTESIRELEGIVTALLAHATILNQDITVALARTVIGNSVKLSKRQITFEMITEVVANHYNIESEILFGKTRKREIADARQLVMYLSKNKTQLSSTNIGVRFARNHATVLHACKQIEQRLSIDPKFKAEIAEIEDVLKKY